ncbi:hypothetical protein AB6A40_002060 [Gnathostoma spinigerum]|uniref:Probable prefoldin subunit 6 n=1 Tax=Gnathostoma spinigerum TaxID=75299 RepID=A0ABD6E6X8_9BILA
MTSESVDSLKARFEEELKKYKQLERDNEKNITNRQQLEGQLTENNLVKAEMDLLGVDDVVYKLIGPVLVKQDVAEAKENVNKRIAYIKTEINRLEEIMADCKKKHESQKETLMLAQNQLKQKLSTQQQQ